MTKKFESYRKNNYYAEREAKKNMNNARSFFSFSLPPLITPHIPSPIPSRIPDFIPSPFPT